MTITITRKKYEAAVEAARDNYIQNGNTLTTAIGAFLAAAGIEVEKTPEERIAAFVADVKPHWCMQPGYGGYALREMVERHFPEMRSGG